MWANYVDEQYFPLFIYFPPPTEIYSQIVSGGIAQALAATFHSLMAFAWAVSMPQSVAGLGCAFASLCPLSMAELILILE